jgi:hypothetical protein
MEEANTQGTGDVVGPEVVRRNWLLRNDARFATIWFVLSSIFTISSKYDTNGRLVGEELICCNFCSHVPFFVNCSIIYQTSFDIDLTFGDDKIFDFGLPESLIPRQVDKEMARNKPTGDTGIRATWRRSCS